jgi:hypothetical protein
VADDAELTRRFEETLAEVREEEAMANGFDAWFGTTYGDEADETNFDTGEMWEAYAAGWKAAAGVPQPPADIQPEVPQ